MVSLALAWVYDAAYSEGVALVLSSTIKTSMPFKNKKCKASQFWGRDGAGLGSPILTYSTRLPGMRAAYDGLCFRRGGWGGSGARRHLLWSGASDPDVMGESAKK